MCDNMCKLGRKVIVIKTLKNLKKISNIIFSHNTQRNGICLSLIKIT